MKRSVLLRLAPMALLIGTAMVGCSPTMRSHPAFAAKPIDEARFGARAAERAGDALAAKDAAGAVAAAEIAVAAAPDNAGYRVLLAQSYLADGRFASAAASFRDTLTLDPANGRAAFGQVLALIGAGHADEARAAVKTLPASVPVSDRGLALALAGDREGGIALLEPAARSAAADQRTRQNLALAYALAGSWEKASATAAQDVSAADLPARLAGWAQFADGASGADQVAALLGTRRDADPGVPSQLALATPATAPVALAQSTPVAVDAPALDAAPVEIALAPPPLIAAPIAAPVQLASVPALIRAPRTPFKRPAAATVALARAAAPHRSILLARAAPIRPTIGGSFVVQLGAFRDAARVEHAWAQSTARVATLAGYTPSSMATLTTDRSATLTRLSIAGFSTRASATAVCRAVKQAGGVCFVRAQAGDNPVHWASREQPARA